MFQIAKYDSFLLKRFLQGSLSIDADKWRSCDTRIALTISLGMATTMHQLTGKDKKSMEYLKHELAFYGTAGVTLSPQNNKQSALHLHWQMDISHIISIVLSCSIIMRSGLYIICWYIKQIPGCQIFTNRKDLPTCDNPMDLYQTD